MKTAKGFSPKTKILSLILSFLIIFYLVPASVFAEGLDNDATVSDSSVSENEENSTYTPEIYEVTELREENVKHFRLADGSYVAAQYNYPVHYTDGDGQLVDIDNRLIDSKSEFSTNNSRVKFIKKITGNGNIFTLHENNTKITMGLVGAEKKTEGVVKSTHNSDDVIEDTLGKLTNLENISSTILYEDILDGVDIEYIVHSLNIKENIIVKEKKDTYSYTFTIELNNLTANLTENGDVHIVSLDGETQYVIPAPVVYDANGNYALDNVSAYSLSTTGNGKYELNVTVDSDWMNNDSRAFPITIDPTIGVPHNYTTDLDIASGAPSVSFEDSFSLNVSSTWRTYWKIPTAYLPTLPSTAYIWKAELKLFGGGYNTYVGAYEISSNWDETLTWNKTISSNPQGLFSGNMLDYHKLSSGDNWYAFDLTEVAKKWYDGENNYGVGFKLVDGTDTTRVAQFYSYEYYDDYDDRFVEPCFYVYYSDISGLEDYYSLSSHSVAGIGTGSINLASGSLTLISDLISTTDHLMPMTVSAVYNSDMAGKDYNISNSFSAYATSYMPYGFKLNISETIVEKMMRCEDGSNTNYCILSDADGTNHYFYYVFNKGYIDDSGLGRTLNKLSTNEIEIVFKDQSKKTYTKMSSNPAGTIGGWVLSKITDASGNSVIISLDNNSAYRPTQISLLPKGNTSDIDMLSFSYSGNKLTGIQNLLNSDYITLACSNNYLNALTFGNNRTSTIYTSANIQYDSNGKIESITNNKNLLKISYTWNSGKVSGISEYAGTTLGQQVSYIYGERYTDIRSTGNDEALNNDDDIITRYVFDSYGRTVSVYSMSIDGTEIYGATSGSYDDSEKSKNSIKSSAVLSGVDQGDIIENTSRTDGNFAVIQSNVTTNESDGTYVQTVFYEEDVASLMFSNANMEYIISGFGYSNCIIQNEVTDFSLGINVYYYQGTGADDEVVKYRFGFTDAENIWQYVCGKFYCKLESTDSVNYDYVKKIEVVCSYYGHTDTESEKACAYFKDIALTNFTEESGYDYEYYSSSGNLRTKSNSLYGEEYEYDGENKITKTTNSYNERYEYSYRETSDGKEKYEYYYKGPNDNDLVSATAYIYNTYGLLTHSSYFGSQSGTLTSSNAGSFATINTSYQYDVTPESISFGALIKETDSLGHITTYAYCPDTGYLASQIDISSGTGYFYTYTPSGELSLVKPIDLNSSVECPENVVYSYDSADYLNQIITQSTTYNLAYDDFGNSTVVSVGNNALATYEYYPNNGKLKKINYGNGFSEDYVYDALEMLSEIWYTIDGIRTKAYSYTYNPDGTIDEITDHSTGKITQYTYDNRGRLTSIKEKIGDSSYNTIYSVNYDLQNRVLSQRNIISYTSNGSAESKCLTTSYNYTGSYLTTETHSYLSNNHKISYSYDGFNRFDEVVIDFGSFDYTKQYNYVSNGNNTSNRVSSVLNTINNVESYYQYTYDSKGNITKTVYNASVTTNYTYDDIGQLIGESEGNVTYTYTYDNAGNITSIEKTVLNENAGIVPRPWVLDPTNPPSLYLTYTDTLAYTNSQWGDLLTSFNGTTITYDAIGNPLSYYNGSSYTFTWEGRKLTEAVKGLKTMSFTYNDEGIRTSKTVNGVTHTYQLNGSQIVTEQWEDKLLVYLYDAAGSPIGMMYRITSYELNEWATFFFEKNLQGDIVAVYNESGTKLVTYEYDAWGNQTVTYHAGSSSGPAQYNPFRYRGYYYDADLGMYYLQSRYYDSKICRFINEDVYISTGFGIIGNNMFAYCNNNPICYSDPEGTDLMYTCDYDEGYTLNGWLLEGGGAGGNGGGGSDFGLGTAYHNYAVYSNTATYDAYLGGYYYGGGGYIGGYTAQFATGRVSVTDSMVTNTSGSTSIQSPTNASPPKFTADQSALFKLAKEYKKTGMTLSEANIMWDWANEYGLSGSRYHGPQYDRYLGGSQLHFKINGIHINIYN